MNVKSEIISSLEKSIKNVTGQDIIPQLEHPVDESHGDYATNIALTLFASEKRKAKSEKLETPMELAEKIAENLRLKIKDLRVVEKVDVVKPGFINFWISKEYLFSQLKEVLSQKEKYGSKKEDPNKKVVVEYSSPNIAKPFTVGHLRSTIIGQAISNLLCANGWKVYRDNHLGDWGTQFGKQIYAIKKWGNEEEISKAENPVKLLVDLYVKFHQEAEKNPNLEEEGRVWFKKLEDGDNEARRLWQRCIEWSLKEFQKIYKALDVKFTENNGLGYGESFFEDKMGLVIKELKEKNLLKESEGAKLIFFDPSASSGQAKYPPLMILKQDGATLYATRDLATDKFRLDKYGKDIVVINEVGIEQSLYFKQIFEIEKLLGWYKEGQRFHVKHGLYRFKDEKMSTRKGNTIWLEDVLIEAQKRAVELAKDKNSLVAKEVGIGALKWNDLKRGSNLDIVFDWDEILNMEGNSGPYLQYVYARTQSVLSKSRIQNLEFKISFAGGDPAKLEGEEVLLLRALNKFPEIVEEAGEKFAPNLLCNYLFDLAQKFNLFYQKHKILESEQKDFRLALTQGVGQVIKNGLGLLGISSPGKM